MHGEKAFACACTIAHNCDMQAVIESPGTTRLVARRPCQKAAGYTIVSLLGQEKYNHICILRALVSHTGGLPCPYENAEQGSAKHGSNRAPQRHERGRPRCCSGQKRACKKHCARVLIARVLTPDSNFYRCSSQCFSITPRGLCYSRRYPWRFWRCCGSLIQGPLIDRILLPHSACKNILNQQFQAGSCKHTRRSPWLLLHAGPFDSSKHKILRCLK